MKLAALALVAALGSSSLIAQSAPTAPTPANKPVAGSATNAPAPAFLIADVHNSKYSAYPNMHGGQIFGDRYVLHEAMNCDIAHTVAAVVASLRTTLVELVIWLHSPSGAMKVMAELTVPAAPGLPPLAIA